MTRVLIVDWLGRGGIAQTADAWRRALRAGGHEVYLVTRDGLELGVERSDVGVRRPIATGRLGWHAGVARHALVAIDRIRPHVVVVQNYIVPALEAAVFRRAHRRGATVVFVVHNHVPHERRAGLSAGLGRHVAAADVVVAHSRFVADRLPPHSHVRVLPLPRPDLLLAGTTATARPSDVRTLLQFGVMRRAYKGADLLERLARGGIDGWNFRLVGVGAGEAIIEVPQALSVRPGYVPNRDLAEEVRAAALVALPYRAASQSAALVLAQAVGTPPIATRVGGLPEQIDHGVDGFLVAPDACDEQWRTILRSVDDSSLSRMSAAARRRVARDQAHFEQGVQKIV